MCYKFLCDSERVQNARMQVRKRIANFCRKTVNTAMCRPILFCAFVFRILLLPYILLHVVDFLRNKRMMSLRQATGEAICTTQARQEL